MKQTIITKELVAALQREFALDWNGIHGAAHWARVRANGLRLATTTGARCDVVELFAFVHDVKREHDGRDRKHGERAAVWAQSVRGSLIHLNDRDFDLLVQACALHSTGGTTADVTVQTCWDADRLDLGRVGTIPHPEKLCTSAARDWRLIRWAYARSVRSRRFAYVSN